MPQLWSRAYSILSSHNRRRLHYFTLEEVVERASLKSQHACHFLLNFPIKIFVESSVVLTQSLWTDIFHGWNVRANAFLARGIDFSIRSYHPRFDVGTLVEIDRIVGSEATQKRFHNQQQEKKWHRISQYLTGCPVVLRLIQWLALPSDSSPCTVDCFGGLAWCMRRPAGIIVFIHFIRRRRNSKMKKGTTSIPYCLPKRTGNACMRTR